MRTILLALVLASVATEAGAIQRYNSTSMSCSQVRATISADGAAIMRWASRRVANLPLYGRYVRNDQFCSQREEAKVTYIPARDTESCPVYECQRKDPEDDLFNWRRRFH